MINIHILSAKPKTTKAAATKKPPATSRTVQIHGCDDDDNIRAEDDQTLTGKIIVQDCPCEKRFSNATRLLYVSNTVTTQLRSYFQKLYKTDINYQVTVKVTGGNKTHTFLSYTVKVPQADHSRAKTALQQTCKDDTVSQFKLEDLFQSISISIIENEKL
jgi:hypothetical protein